MSSRLILCSIFICSGREVAGGQGRKMRLCMFALLRVNRPLLGETRRCPHSGSCLRMVRRAVVATIPPTVSNIMSIAQRHSGSLQSPKVSVKLVELMDELSEARELIAEAKESVGSVYVMEDIEDARKQTEKTLTLWKEFLDFLGESGDAALLESLRKEHELKFSQLRAELEDAEHIIGHD